MSIGEDILKALWELSLDSAAVADVRSDDLRPLVEKAVSTIAEAVQSHGHVR